MHLFSCFSLFWINNQILSLNNSSTLFSFALFNFNFNYVVIYWVRLGFYLVFSFLLFYLDNVSKNTHSKRMNNFLFCLDIVVNYWILSFHSRTLHFKSSFLWNFKVNFNEIYWFGRLYWKEFKHFRSRK